MGSKWVQSGPKMGHFGGDIGADFRPFLGRSGVILGSLSDHFGMVFASFWVRFGILLTPF